MRLDFGVKSQTCKTHHPFCLSAAQTGVQTLWLPRLCTACIPQREMGISYVECAKEHAA